MLITISTRVSSVNRRLISYTPPHTPHRHYPYTHPPHIHPHNNSNISISKPRSEQLDSFENLKPLKLKIINKFSYHKHFFSYIDGTQYVFNTRNVKTNISEQSNHILFEQKLVSKALCCWICYSLYLLLTHQQSVSLTRWCQMCHLCFCIINITLDYEDDWICTHWETLRFLLTRYVGLI